VKNLGKSVSKLFRSLTRGRIAPYLGLGLLLLILYDPGRMENTSGDTISTRYWPVAILRHGTITMNPFKESLDGVGYAAVYMNNGNWVPRLDWGMAVFTVPFYAVIELIQWGEPWTHERVNQVSRWNGIAIAIMLCCLLFAQLRKRVSPEIAWVACLLFGISTWNWSLAAQGLTNQAAALIWAVASIWPVERALTEKKQTQALAYSVLCGWCHALLWATRPSDVFLCAIMPGLLLLRSWRLATAWLFAALSISLPLMMVLENYYDHPLGFRGLLTAASFGSSLAIYQFNGIEGILGVLFSPNRGALIFAPVVLLFPWMAQRYFPAIDPRKAFKALPLKGKHLLSPNLSLALFWGVFLQFFVLCNTEFWHATWSYGSRYLFQLQPFVWFGVAAALQDLRSRLKVDTFQILLALSLAWGTWIHALGHTNYDLYVWNFQHGKRYQMDAWNYSEWMIQDVWKAGSNLGRYPNIEKRLRDYGF
jgi:hypothetical protein